MERCTEHDLLNCRCREPLASFLVRQFQESSRDRVVRSASWVSSDHSSDSGRGGVGDHRRGQSGEPGGAR
jgi:hypothetical protein